MFTYGYLCIYFIFVVFRTCAILWRAVLSHSSHHRQEALLAQFSPYVHKDGLKPDSCHFICTHRPLCFILFSNCFTANSYNNLLLLSMRYLSKFFFIILNCSLHGYYLQ